MSRQSAATADRLIESVLKWAKEQAIVRAVALVGSYANGTARPESDIDFVLLTTTPTAYRDDTRWLDGIDWGFVGSAPAKWADEDYGSLWSRRVWLKKDCGELEISFALPSWAAINPTDPGTWQVIADGCRILYDPDGLLTRLTAVVSNGPGQVQS